MNNLRANLFSRIRSFSFIVVVLIIVSPALSLAQWRSKAKALKKRSEVTSVVYKGKLYTFLGFKDADLNTEPSLEVYDPVTNKWKLLKSLPADKSVTHQGVALIDDNVWHIGGRVGKNPGPLSSGIWIYNITNNSWSAGPQVKDPATGNPILWGGGGAVFLGRTLHVFGGFITNACDNNDDQSIYHLTLNIDDWLANPGEDAPWKNESAPLPIRRNHFATIVLGGKIYAIGGQLGHDCEGLDKQYSHVYDPVTNTWKELSLLPTPRSHIEGSTFAIDGKIYTAAGQGQSGQNTNKVTIFNPAANRGAGSWTVDNNLVLPHSYEGLSAKVINSAFIISHGGQGSSRNTMNTTYTRTISRKPVYKFGFPSACGSFKLRQGSSAKINTLLFTIDSSKQYVTTTSAGWLTVSKNASGTAIQNGIDIELTANTSGLAPGNYKATVTASSVGSEPAYTSASYCVNLTVSAADTLEAELATIHNITISSEHTGFTGNGYADYTNPTGDFIEWTLNKTNAGTVFLNFRYANGGTTDRPLRLEINGAVVDANLAFPVTDGWTKWSFTILTADLLAGENKIRLTANGSSGPNIDHLGWSEYTETLPVSDGILEAELAEIKDVSISSQHAGFTGNGYGDYTNATGDFIEWTLNKAGTGPAYLNFRYTNGGTTDRPLRLEINGIVVNPNFSFTPTKGWEKWSFTTIIADLLAGENKIRLTAIGYNGPNIDYLSWSENISASTNSMKRTSAVPANLKTLIIPGHFKISVFPNPVSESAKLFIESSSGNRLEIVIMDMSGKAHKRLNINPAKSGYIDFSVRELSSGSYFIIVKQGEKRTTARFIVQR